MAVRPREMIKLEPIKQTIKKNKLTTLILIN